MTASLSYYFTKKNQLEREAMTLKFDYYKNFIEALSDAVIDQNEEANKRLSNGFNTLPLVANSAAVEKLMEYHLLISDKTIDRNTEEWSKKHEQLLTELIKRMREDLHNKKEFNDNFPNIHLVGSEKKQ